MPRRRFTDEEILAELTACAARLGRSPSMRELAADPGARLHPQTVVERFGSWNHAKRAARLAPRRFATQDELLVQLRALGDSLGRTPTGRDLDECRSAMPSKSLYWHSFGSLSNALRAAGYDVPTRAERAERALEQGERLARRLGRLPRLSDWARASARSPTMLSEWQVYRLFGEGQGGWRAFHGALRGRLSQRGTTVDAKGLLEIRSASPAASARTPTP